MPRPFLYTYVPKSAEISTQGLRSISTLNGDEWKKYCGRAGSTKKEDVLKWLEKTIPGRTRGICVFTQPIPDNAPPAILAFRDSHRRVTIKSFDELKKDGIITACYAENLKWEPNTRQLEWIPVDHPDWNEKLVWDGSNPKLLFVKTEHYLIITKDGVIPPKYLTYSRSSNEDYSEEVLAEKAIKNGYLYHGSPNRYTVLKPQTQEDVNGKKVLSFSPFKCISSMFVIPVERLIRGYHRCRLRYDEWFNPPQDKYKPLTMVHVYHNIRQMGDFEKVFSGYLYTVKAEDVLQNATDNPEWRGEKEVLAYAPEIHPVKTEQISVKVVFKYDLKRCVTDHDAVPVGTSEETLMVHKYTDQDIKDAKVVYRGSPHLEKKLHGNMFASDSSAVYVSPYKGIASMFCISRDTILAAVGKQLGKRIVKSNFTYSNWAKDGSDETLNQIPRKITIGLNVRGFSPIYGEAEGYLYTIDATKYNIKMKPNGKEGIIHGEVEYMKYEPIKFEYVVKPDEENIKENGEAALEGFIAKEELPESVKQKLGKYLYHGTHRDLDIKQLAVHFCKNRANLDIKAPVVYMTRSLGLACLHCAEFMKGHASKMKGYKEHFVDFDKAKNSDDIIKHVEIVHNDPDLPEASGENDGFIYCTETAKCLDKLYFSTPKNKNDYLFVSYSPLPVDKKLKIHITWHRKYDENFAKEVKSDKYAGIESLFYDFDQDYYGMNPEDYIPDDDPMDELKKKAMGHPVDTSTEDLSLDNVSMEENVVQEQGTYVFIRGFPVAAFFKQLSKHYQTHKLENLIHVVHSIGIAQWTVNTRTVKIHRFFLPEIVYLLTKFNMSQTLIGDIQRGSWMGAPITNKTDCKVDRISANMNCTLMPHQQTFVENYADLKDSHRLRGYLLSFGQGLGKTITAIALMEALGKERVVVICPKNTMVETWKSHFQRFYKKEQSIYVAGFDKKFNGERFCIFNYDAIDKLNALDGVKTSKMGIIVDESHNFLRIEAARTRKLISLAKDSDDADVLLISGTPIKSNGKELIPLISMLDPLFDDEAATIFKDSFGVNTKIATEVLHARLKRMMERVTKDALNLPPKRRSVIKVKLPDGRKYTIKEVKKGMKVYINERLKFHRDHMVEYRQEFDECMRYLQSRPIAKTPEFQKYRAVIERLMKHGGRFDQGDEEVAWANAYEKSVVEREFPSELLQKFRHCKAAIKYLHLKVRGEVLGQFLAKLRIEMTTAMLKVVNIKQLIDEAEKKTIIFSSFIDTIETCEQHVRALGYKPIIIYGKNSSEIAPLAAKFQKDQSYNPLIASLQTLSTGATLTAANRVIFLNKPWRSIDYEQASDRVHRIGQDMAVDIISLVLDTGDEGNLSTRMEDIMDASARAFDAIVEERKQEEDKKLRAAGEDYMFDLLDLPDDVLDEQNISLEGMTLLHDTHEQRVLNHLAKPHYRPRGANSWEHVQQDLANGILLIKELKHRDLTLQEYATVLWHDSACKSIYPEKVGHGVKGGEIAKKDLKDTGFFTDEQIEEIYVAICEHDETTNPKNLHSSELSDFLASADTNPIDIPWQLNKSYVWGLRHGQKTHEERIKNVVKFMPKLYGSDGEMVYPKLFKEYYASDIKAMQKFYDQLTEEQADEIITSYRNRHRLAANELTLPEPNTDEVVIPSTESLEPSMEAAKNIKAKRKKIEEYVLKSMKLLDPHTDTNYKYWKDKFDSMNDKDFDDFMHYLREGKTNIHMFVPPFKVTLQTKEMLDAAHKLGVKIMHRIWMTDPHTGIRYLTPEEYMVLQLPVRRQQQFLDEKLSVPDNDKTIDGLTGQVTGDSKSCSITNPEIQILHARNLDATLYEFSNVRGGNIRNYAEFKRSLEETGSVKLEQLDPTNRTRVAVMGQVLLTAMHLDVNLVDI